MELDKCVWCGKNYFEHDEARPEFSSVPRVPCLMLRSGFTRRYSNAPLVNNLEGWREEFKDFFAITITPKDRADYKKAFLMEQEWREGFMNNISDWWLQKFTDLQQKVEKIPTIGINEYIKKSKILALFPKDNK